MTEQPADAPRNPMADHVINKIGLHAPDPDGPCGNRLHLHVSPMVLEDDGHVDFGVLGVFCDMASSQAVDLGPFLHADISINRIARPTGERLFATATALRSGKRTTIVHLEILDDAGVRVAESTQQIVTMKPSPEMAAAMHDGDREAWRKRFMSAFDGECRLDGRLHDIIGIEREPGGTTCRMSLSGASRNGFGGLHGGVAFDLVTEAAVGAAGESSQPGGALLRYLAPATVGPFRAVPTAHPRDDGSTFAMVEVIDEGQDDLRCIVAEVHLTTPTHPTKA